MPSHLLLDRPKFYLVTSIIDLDIVNHGRRLFTGGSKSMTLPLKLPVLFENEHNRKCPQIQHRRDYLSRTAASLSK